MDTLLLGETCQEEVTNLDSEKDLLIPNTSDELAQGQENDGVLAKIYPDIKLEFLLSKIKQDDTKLKDLLAIKLKEIDAEDFLIKKIFKPLNTKHLFKRHEKILMSDNTVYSSSIDEVWEKFRSKQRIRPLQFLLLAFNFKPVLDRDTYEGGIKGLDWGGIDSIMKDLEKLSSIAQYINSAEENRRNWFTCCILGISEQDYNEQLVGVRNIRPVIMTALSKLKQAKNELRKEYIVSHFGQVAQESKLYNEEVLQEFLGYFQNDQELEEVCTSIKKAKEDARQEDIRQIQETLHKLDKVHVSIRELKKDNAETWLIESCSITY